MMRRVAFFGCLLAGLGCTPDKPAEHPVVQMAQFDLQCPKAELHYFKINEETWGVRGCGKQAKYVLICSWGTTTDEECRWLQN
jgi:hypothetical protein